MDSDIPPTGTGPDAWSGRAGASAGDMTGMIPGLAAGRKARTVLMLMGHPSMFWRDLGLALNASGHRVLKLNFCLADWVFWRGLPSRAYRGRFRDWPAWLAEFAAREGVTDILYYADRHPYHVAARTLAEAAGIRAWAIEFGYLRPDWITMEPGGMGRHSHFPRVPADIHRLAQGRDLPDMSVIYPHRFGREAFNEVTFHLLQAYGRPFFPRFLSDRPYWPAIDYLSWLPELALSSRRARHADAVERAGAAGPFALVALQLQADYQIRSASDYTHLSEFLDEVFASFAAHAPGAMRLVVKLHPLDNGLERWFRRVPPLARAHGIAERIDVIKGGDLDRLIARSAGVVLVNSTVGIHSLRQGVPVCARGSPIYDVPGLSHQGGLDRFWTAPERPDAALVEAFLRALTRIQIKGSFYNQDGKRAAIAEIVQRLGQDGDPLAVDGLSRAR